MRVGENRYKPTAYTGGAWSPDEQHFSPLGGLIVHAIDRYLAAQASTDKVLSRISFDILGRLAVDECEIRVETMRRGRTIELIEATVVIAGQAAVRARAWLLGTFDTAAVAGDFSCQLPPPETLDSWPLTDIWAGGYIASLDMRPVAPPKPGQTTAWITTRLDLIAGETSSPLASYIALIDTANGIAVRQSPATWMFPNVDLTIHFYRQPTGRWVGLDTTVTFGPAGQGLTSTTLHDVGGPIGQAQQILTVRSQPIAGARRD
ncbi:thioesterase family protein [Nocardia sp. NPDC051756]|uniref:thioesterase family protein n=1 Tax=Nocardia sp. NPDC051756 TaxID=3154751 RepID=UPI00341DDA99